MSKRIIIVLVNFMLLLNMGVAMEVIMKNAGNEVNGQFCAR